MLENRLEQPQISANPELATLQERAIEMARYYYKGFGNSLVGIMANGEEYLSSQDANLLQHSYQLFQKIEDFYANIPFNTLNGKEEYYPLFVVNRLLPKFRQSMDELFIDKRRDSLQNLQTNLRTIVDIGQLYFNSLMELLKTIRQFPEARDFRVAIPDQLKKHVWYF